MGRVSENFGLRETISCILGTFKMHFISFWLLQFSCLKSVKKKKQKNTHTQVSKKHHCKLVKSTIWSSVLLNIFLAVIIVKVW